MTPRRLDPRRPGGRPALRRQLQEACRRFAHDFECGMLDWGLFLRGERQVFTAEMALVLLANLISVTLGIASGACLNALIHGRL